MDHHNHNAMVGNMTVHYQPTNSSFSRPANWSETMNHGHHVQGQALQMDHGMHQAGHSSIFHFGHYEVVLFSFWAISSASEMIVACFGMFILAVLYEGLRVFREWLLQKPLRSDRIKHDWDASNSSASENRSRLLNASEHGNPTDSASMQIRSKLRPNPFSWMHFLQTILHMLQIFVSYVLMLVFMTYNVWLCLSVVLGAGFGYLIFGWLKGTTLDYDHCH